MSELKFERILWQDHCSTGSKEWEKLSDILDLAPIDVVTIGWIAKETDTYLIVVPTFYSSRENEDCGYGELCILKGNIVERKVLA